MKTLFNITLPHLRQSNLTGGVYLFEGGETMKKLSVFTMVFLIVCISTSVSYSEYYWAKTYGGPV